MENDDDVGEGLEAIPLTPANLMPTRLRLGEGTERYKVGDAEGEVREIGGLKRVNIFVGPNNSGKSTLVRSIVGCKPENIVFEPGAVKSHYREQMMETMNRLRRECALKFARDADAIESIGDVAGRTSFSLLREIAEDDSVFTLSSVLKNFHSFTQLCADQNFCFLYAGSSHRVADVQKCRPILESVSKLRQQDPSEKISLSAHYIPVLRSLRRLGDSDLYEKLVRDDHFQLKNTSEANIATGLDFYGVLKKHLLGSYEMRCRVREFEQFLSDAFFEGEEITLIPRIEDGNLVIQEGARKEMPIHKLGDGIQQIILLTFPVFMLPRDTLHLIAIDEPEISLHPGLQRVFLETICRPEFDHVQFYITTQSNHFLDITQDFDLVSLYRVSRDPVEARDGAEPVDATFEVRNVPAGETQMLADLGAKAASVFMANCTIWVEGVTDRRFLAHFLDLYQRDTGGEEFTEDLHFTFVYYGGANLVNWSVLKDDGVNVNRLTTNMFLVMDGDNPDDTAKLEREKILTKRLGARFMRLACREIENLVPPEALASIVKEWSAIPTIPTPNYEDYSSKLLGTYIEGELVRQRKSTKRGKKKYAAASGTINEKSAFCQKALDEITSFDELPQEAQDLTKRLHEFIVGANS